jgi:hypothetical protein
VGDPQTPMTRCIINKCGAGKQAARDEPEREPCAHRDE